MARNIPNRRDQRRLKSVLAKLEALCDSENDRPCAVAAEHKRAVAPYVESWVIPLLEKGNLTVDLTDSLMCASFTEEAFGGLVRKVGVNYGKDIVNRLNLIGDAADVREAWGFIHAERARQGVNVDDE